MAAIVGTAQAVGAVITALNAASTLIANASQVSQNVQSATMQGRDLTDEEMTQARALDDAARAVLDAEIKKAGG